MKSKVYKSMITTEIYINYIDGEYISEKSLREIEILSEGLTTDALKRGYNKLISYITKQLKSFRINVNQLQSSAKQRGLIWQKKFRKGFEEGKTPKSFSAIILSDIKDELKKITHNIKMKLGMGDYPVEILFALVAIALMYFLNTGLVIALMHVIAPRIAFFIVASILGPMIEEAAKNFAIQRGHPWLGTGLMFGAEFAMYIPRLLTAGHSITAAIISRLVGLAMHFFTTFVQKKIIDKGIEEGENREFAAWAAGVAMHASWNALAALPILLGMTDPI